MLQMQGVAYAKHTTNRYFRTVRIRTQDFSYCTSYVLHMQPLAFATFQSEYPYYVSYFTEKESNTDPNDILIV